MFGLILEFVGASPLLVVIVSMITQRYINRQA